MDTDKDTISEVMRKAGKYHISQFRVMNILAKGFTLEEEIEFLDRRINHDTENLEGEKLEKFMVYQLLQDERAITEKFKMVREARKMFKKTMAVIKR